MKSTEAKRAKEKRLMIEAAAAEAQCLTDLCEKTTVLIHKLRCADATKVSDAQIRQETTKLPSAIELARIVAQIEPTVFQPHSDGGMCTQSPFETDEQRLSDQQQRRMKVLAHRVLQSLKTFEEARREHAFVALTWRQAEDRWAVDYGPLRNLIEEEVKARGPFPRKLSDFEHHVFGGYTTKKRAAKLTAFLEYFATNNVDRCLPILAATGEQLRVQLMEIKIPGLLWLEMQRMAHDFGKMKQLEGAREGGRQRDRKKRRCHHGASKKPDNAA